MSHIEIEELLLRWEEMRDGGQPVSAESLCQSCTELIEPLQRRIEELQKMDAVLDGRSHDAQTTASTPLRSIPAYLEHPGIRNS